MIAIANELMKVPFRTESLRSAGVNLAYRAFGEKTSAQLPILLLHGLLYFSYDWIPIASALSRDREVIALDQRGFGDSEWSPGESYQVGDFVADIEQAISHFGWSKCIVVGHSMGGRHALAAAEALPERIAGLMILDAPPSNAPHGARRIGDQVAGTPERFRSLDHVLNYFPATPWSDPFDTSRRDRFRHYVKDSAVGLVIKRDPYFHRLFSRVKETWPYHSYEGETWPMGQEFDHWRALRSIRCPATIFSGTGVGDMTSPEMIRKLNQFIEANKLSINHVALVAHHNLPGRHADRVLSEVGLLADRIKIELDTK